MATTQAVLAAEGLRYRYGETVALDGVDLRVDPGECVALLGPNGAGKSTLVAIAVGLLTPQHGTVRILGGDPRRAATRRQLGVAQQTLGFPNTLTVRELVTGAAVRGGLRAAAAGPILAELGLTELAPRRVSKLSGGQKQRVQLAMALVTEPTLLVLDEPTVGLDTAARRHFWQILARRRAQGAAVLVTTHLIEESAAVADRVVVLDRGRILADAPPQELVDRLPDRTVTARTGIASAELERLPGVLSVRREHDLTRIQTRSPEDLLRVLLARDPGLSELRVQDAGLEEAVVALTGDEEMVA
ncbi:ABC transporter ATP-binding protein [Streptomyces fuscichromogenes]|uniref:Multidrug ABC transporter ATP-binding protein n=1 Tax=Streptomyces fuscichromogenes TaxID=1324013 RepID=A0A917XH94_9ACTN|nr:ABC transporter ATP-binding protein [Streptomyces fuscichromogenes]GGN26383.1 multidrug ABC transporter ATP-binding protein [Streptomyces fuscichromogenes]